jgi:hypothetical protein
LKRRTGRWEAQCWIGGKTTYLGHFGSEKESARAWDRMRLWLCKASGKKKEEVQLNFPLSDYNDTEVTALQRCTHEKMIHKLRRTGQEDKEVRVAKGIIEKLRRTEERVANQWSGYTRVTLDTRTGRWLARCGIGGRRTSLGTFGSEEEAARAWERMMLWSCKADGKIKEEVQLNFPLFEYGDDEVTALQGLTQEEMIHKLRQTGQEERVAKQSSKYRGMYMKRIGRLEAQCHIGGKRTSLGYFGSEEEAARTWDRARLWSCEAPHGQSEEGVEVGLNNPLSEYSAAEVTALQGCTQEEIIQKLRRSRQGERVAKQSYKYTGVSLQKNTGRWRGDCTIGGKQTYLGHFGSEEEAAGAWDRMRLWSCKADGKTKEEVQLIFSLFEYSDDEVTVLQGLTQEEIIQKSRRKEERVANQMSGYTGVTLHTRTGRNRSAAASRRSWATLAARRRLRARLTTFGSSTVREYVS